MAREVPAGSFGVRSAMISSSCREQKRDSEGRSGTRRYQTTARRIPGSANT
jgi:hypothetical protein